MGLTASLDALKEKRVSYCCRDSNYDSSAVVPMAETIPTEISQSLHKNIRRKEMYIKAYPGGRTF